MDIESAFSLLKNAAMLVAMVYVLDIVIGPYKHTQSFLTKIFAGLALGVICITVMLMPLEFAPGFIFDTRSIVLGLTGLFFSALTTVIVVVMAVISRYMIGGVGTLTGILVILTSAAMGMLLRKYKFRQLHEFAWYQFYGFSLAVTSTFLLLLLYTMPGPQAITALSRVGLPIIIIYPLVMTLLAFLLVNRIQRDQMTKALTKNVERLQMALSDGGLELYEVDLSTGVVTLDSEIAELPGAKSAGKDGNPGARTLTAERWLDMVVPEDRDRMAQLKDDVTTGKLTQYSTEFCQFTDTGERINLLTSAKVTEWDREGKPLRLLGTFMDITRQRASEEQASIFSTLLDQSTDAIEVIDPDTGKFLNVNETGHKQLGYTKAEFLQLSIFDIDPEVDLQTFREGVVRMREQGPLHWIGTHFRKEGSSFPVEVNIKLVTLERDYIVAVTRDITKREKIRKIMNADAVRHRLLIEGSRDGIVIMDELGGVFEANRQFATMLGYEPEEVMKLHVWDWDYQWDRQHLLGMLRIVDEQGDHFETSHRRKDGTVFDVEISTNGTVVGDQKLVFCVCRDITERKRAEAELNLAALVYRNSREGMMITNAAGRIVTVNHTFTTITGYTAEEVIGKPPSMLQSGEHDEAFYRAMWKSLNDKGYWEGEIMDKRKNGEIFPQWMSIHAAYDDDSQVSHWVAQFSDISDRKQTEEMIWKRTNFDALTGLPNRLMLNELLHQAITKTAANDTILAFLSLDLDHFQAVNDALGHEAGDLLLQEVARRLQELFRQSEVVARVSGDEFVIIMADLGDVEIVINRANKVLQKMAAPFTLGDQTVYISVSIGITLYPDDAESITNLFNNAEQAMSSAKRRGRNHFEFFTPAMHKQAGTRLVLATELRAAIGTEQFQVVYQPVIDLRSGDMIKAEALIRWQHPQRGPVSPVEFIGIAEDIDLITEIDNFVFGEALVLAAALRQQRPGFRISVNKSPVDFQGVEKGRADKWLAMLEKAGVSGDAMVLEITESLLLDASPAINALLAQYHDAGIEVALDDFGTGYSSLSYLRRFNIDYLKIDRSFVSNLQPGGEDMLLCEAIISMAHKLHLKVIAEGVEDKNQCELLTAMGCDFGQGYLFAKPMSGDELRQMLPLNHLSANVAYDSH